MRGRERGRVGEGQNNEGNLLENQSLSHPTVSINRPVAGLDSTQGRRKRTGSDGEQRTKLPATRQRPPRTLFVPEAYTNLITHRRKWREARRVARERTPTSVRGSERTVGEKKTGSRLVRKVL